MWWRTQHCGFGKFTNEVTEELRCDMQVGAGESPGQWCCRGNWDVLPSTGGTRKANFWSISPDCVVFSPCKLDTQHVRNKLWATGLEAFDSPYQWRICQFGEVVLAYVKSSMAYEDFEPWCPCDCLAVCHCLHSVSKEALQPMGLGMMWLVGVWLHWVRSWCPQTGSLSPVAGESEAASDPPSPTEILDGGCPSCWEVVEDVAEVGAPNPSLPARYARPSTPFLNLWSLEDQLRLGQWRWTRVEGPPSKQRCHHLRNRLWLQRREDEPNFTPRGGFVVLLPYCYLRMSLDVSDAFLTAKQGTPTAVACYREFGLGTAWRLALVSSPQGQAGHGGDGRLLLSTCSTQRPSARTISFRRLVGCGWLFLHWLQLLPVLKAKYKLSMEVMKEPGDELN